MAKQWREIYDEWEKAVAPGLQQLTASDGFRDFMAASAKVTSALTAEFERASRRWLHLWNLPAATDVRKLRQQVAAVDRELKGLKNLVFEVTSAAPGDVAPATNGKAASVPSKATDSKPAAKKTAAKKPAAKKPAAKATAADKAPKSDRSAAEQPAAL